MKNPIGKPRLRLLAAASLTALILAAFLFSTGHGVTDANAQGKPDTCLTSPAEGDPAPAYAIVLDQNASKEDAMQQAEAFSQKLGKDVKVFKHSETYIVILCGIWMDKPEANAQANDAKQSLQDMNPQITLFQRQ